MAPTAPSADRSHRPRPRFRMARATRAGRGRAGLAGLASLSLVGLLVVGTPAGAADVAVTSTADSGPGSLRDAITSANANPGPDIITIPPGSYDRTVAGSDEDGNATGDLDIKGDLTIVGTGGAAVTTIDAEGLDRVFDIHNGDVTLQGLTITGATVPGLTTGAGISQHGGSTLHLLDSVVVANTGFSGAGLNAQGGVVDIQRTEFVNNTALSQPGNGSAGGAVTRHGGPMTIVDSTFENNHAVNGNAGALYVQGLTTITNTTFSGNSAGRSAIVAEAGTNTTTKLTLEFVTIAENTATGSAGNAGVLTNAVQNGTSEVALHGVLFHHNIEGGQPKNCMVQSNGTFSSSGHNLSDDASCAALNQAGDLAADQQTALAALAANGGPTRTHALVAGSSAIDGGGDCAATVPTDQRHAGRPVGAGCDIGAYEHLGVIIPTTTSTTSTSTTSTSTSSTTSTTSTTVPEATTTSTAPESTTTSTVVDESTTTTTSTPDTTSSTTGPSTTSTVAVAGTSTSFGDPTVASVASVRGTLPVTGPADTLRLVLLATLLLSLGVLAVGLARHVLARQLLQELSQFDQTER